jgi:uncharacterized membrane protein YcgQ (UPF0703/DUF1980 family)
MNKGFKIKTKAFDLMQNTNRYDRIRYRYLMFRAIYLGLILLLAIVSYVTNKTIFLK